ncbi:hypothetical protein [Kribbella sp. NPDC048915]|uniref:hypothetical protein n=1 Tax=Kribbella sp. NPDC048915 TaxID=3155148 RepID=UPI0033CFB8DA
MTPLIEQLDSLGIAMDQGLISRDGAIACLAEWRGLTMKGAAAFVDEWPEVKSRYEAFWRQFGDGFQP